MTKVTRDRVAFSATTDAIALLEQLVSFFRRRSIPCYLVGGFVRDGLLGRPSVDIDIALTGNIKTVASEAASLFRGKVVPLDEVHQITRVVLYHAGRRWHVDFSALRGRIEEDLGHRDFTIDAMALDLVETEGNWSHIPVIDPLGGEHDLRKRLIRAVNDHVFRDDPARLLRGVRLASVLDFQLEPHTVSLMKQAQALVTTVAGERLKDEISLIFESSRAYQAVRMLDRLGLLDILFPELAEAKGVEQPKEHYWNVFDHSLETVLAVEKIIGAPPAEEDDSILELVPLTEAVRAHFCERVAGMSRSGLIKLAALLHDVAKPSTKTTESTGRMRFFGHGKEGAETTSHILRRLRFSNRQIRMISTMIEHHLRPGFLSAADVPSRRAIYRYFRDTEDVGIDILYLSLADHLAARGPALDLDEWRRHCEFTGYVVSKWFEERTTVVPPRLIDGHAIIEKFALEPGPAIGELLEMVREAQAAGDIRTPEEALALVAEHLEKGTSEPR
ncbi:MAG: CCA tRNA nucleotidyltransferase [Dehalococcoidia bacterium]|nr:CCA tRNA nucleotidyltransferase [Dehalococcoidia bacterium]